MPEPWAIGVFASIDAGLGVSWDVISQLKVPTIQLHAPVADKRDEVTAKGFKQQLDDLGVACTAVFGGFDGESYADIPTVQQTIGLVPESTRASRLAEMKQISDFAKWLGTDAIALHLGFVPEESSDPGYAAIVETTADLCDYCGGNDQYLHLETGQETAAGLLTFIEAVGRDNLKINFDPANMILYGAGEPIEAVKLLGDHIRSVHCKDGTWSDQPGVTWGSEVALGGGDVGIENYLRALDEIGYRGPLTIEREIPEDPDRQLSEIDSAVTLLTELRSKVLG